MDITLTRLTGRAPHTCGKARGRLKGVCARDAHAPTAAHCASAPAGGRTTLTQFGCFRIDRRFLSALALSAVPTMSFPALFPGAGSAQTRRRVPPRWLLCPFIRKRPSACRRFPKRRQFVGRGRPPHRRASVRASLTLPQV